MSAATDAHRINHSEEAGYPTGDEERFKGPNIGSNCGFFWRKPRIGRFKNMLDNYVGPGLIFCFPKDVL